MIILLILFIFCIRMVGAKQESAKGHFRHTGLKIEFRDRWTVWAIPPQLLLIGSTGSIIMRR
jgi:hypothetical protein